MSVDYKKPTKKSSKTRRKPLLKGFIKRLSYRRKRSYLPLITQQQLLRQSSTPEQVRSLLSDLAPCPLSVFLVLRRDEAFLGEVFYRESYLGVLAARILGREKPFSERQVRRALVVLKELKLLAVQSRKKYRGKYQTNLYAVASFFHLPEFKNVIDSFLYHFKRFKVVSLSFLVSQSFSILRSSFGFWQNVLLNKYYVLHTLTLENYRKIIESLREEKVSAPQMDVNKTLASDMFEYRERDISLEEEDFLHEEMRKLQNKIRFKCLVN